MTAALQGYPIITAGSPEDKLINGSKSDQLEVLRLNQVRPHYIASLERFVWWGAGENNFGLDLLNGVLPAKLRKRIQSEINSPHGRSGVWFRSRNAAMDALREAILTNGTWEP